MFILGNLPAFVGVLCLILLIACFWKKLKGCLVPMLGLLAVLIVIGIVQECNGEGADTGSIAGLDDITTADTIPKMDDAQKAECFPAIRDSLAAKGYRATEKDFYEAIEFRDIWIASGIAYKDGKRHTYSMYLRQDSTGYVCSGIRVDGTSK